MIIGAAKSGTTSLYHYLSEHPDVFMTEPKEVNYFSAEEIERQKLYYKDHKVRSLEEYQSLFAGVKGCKAIGEGSVSYIFYPETPQKIHALLPDIKIIILLRNPVDRGFSHFLMDQRLGLVDLEYKDIIFKSSAHEKASLYFQQYVELGLYFEQVKRYIDIFGREQVKIYLNEDLRSDLSLVVDDLYGFLHLDKSEKPNLEKNHNAFAMPNNKLIAKLYASRSIRRTLSRLVPESLKEKILSTFFNKTKKPTLSEVELTKLHEIYDEDIKQLERLIDRDLSHWYEKK